MEPPILGLSGRQAAEILGIAELSVARLVQRGVLHKAVKWQRSGLDRSEVEQVALARYRPGHPYWLSLSEATQMLGVSRARVGQLVRRGSLPAVRHGRRYFLRRPQTEVIANARDARRRPEACGDKSTNTCHPAHRRSSEDAAQQMLEGGARASLGHRAGLRPSTPTPLF